MTSQSHDFHLAIFDALCACLNLDKNSREAINLIHEAYSETENAPQPPRNRNVIYWSVVQDSSSDPVATSQVMGAGTGGKNVPTVYVTLKYNLYIVCYGPLCEEFANRIRSLLYVDGYGFPRRILRDAGVFPVPDPPLPSILREEEGSLWRQRADLTVSLRVSYEQSASSRGSINVVPAVIIRR